MASEETRIYSINVRGKLYKFGEIGDIEERVSTLETGETTLRKRATNLETDTAAIKNSLNNLFTYNSSTGALTINLDAL